MERIVYTPLSREFLLKRGYCCNNGCKNCPYNYKIELTKEETMRPKPRIPNPSQEEIITSNRKEYSASIDGPGIVIENNTDKWKSGRSENDPVTLWNNLKNDTEYPYDDGVCEGEYVRPTQAEIIEHNRKPCRDYIELSNYTEKMTLVPENLLEKLKDFDYWKEWKNK